jgi:hypothetical protein
VFSPLFTYADGGDLLDGNLTKAQRIQSLAEPTTPIFSYGCLFLGVDPLGSAWPQGRRLFSVDKLNRPSAVEGRALGTSDYQRFDRVNWKKFFSRHPDPPDVLAVRIPRDSEPGPHGSTVSWSREPTSNPSTWWFWNELATSFGTTAALTGLG